MDLSLDELTARLGLSRATIAQRKAAGRLTNDESGKVVCFARLLGHAVHLFGDLEEARQWLKTPQRGLHGAVPLDYAKTEMGAQEVENLLSQLDDGSHTLRLRIDCFAERIYGCRRLLCRRICAARAAGPPVSQDAMPPRSGGVRTGRSNQLAAPAASERDLHRAFRQARSFRDIAQARADRSPFFVARRRGRGEGRPERRPVDDRARPNRASEHQRRSRRPGQSCGNAASRILSAIAINGQQLSQANQSWRLLDARARVVLACRRHDQTNQIHQHSGRRPESGARFLYGETRVHDYYGSAVRRETALDRITRAEGGDTGRAVSLPKAKKNGSER